MGLAIWESGWYQLLHRPRSERSVMGLVTINIRGMSSKAVESSRMNTEETQESTPDSQFKRFQTHSRGPDAGSTTTERAQRCHLRQSSNDGRLSSSKSSHIIRVKSTHTKSWLWYTKHVASSRAKSAKSIHTASYTSATPLYPPAWCAYVGCPPALNGAGAYPPAFCPT